MRFLPEQYRKPNSRITVAIFHLSVKPVSRSAGRSSTAAAAYRAGVEITDRRTGEIHDYSRKRGVESADMVLPEGAPSWALDRAALWNAAELAEKRKDACVAREYEVALPAELSPEQRRALALAFAKDMANREGCAVDVCIHAPGKDGDNRNHHAHILRTTRKVGPDGLTDKLDTEKAGRDRKADLEQVRSRWAELSNAALARAGQESRIDHRSLEAQGVDRPAQIHLGPVASAIERQGRMSEKSRGHQERSTAAELARARARATKTKPREPDHGNRRAAFERVAELGRAAGRNHQTSGRAINASVHHLKAARSDADRNGRDLGRAVQGARRRVDERHLGRAAEAIVRKLEIAVRVVQQVGRATIQLLSQITQKREAEKALKTAQEAFLTKWRGVARAKPGELAVGTLKDVYGQVAVYHVGRGRHVFHQFPPGQKPPELGQEPERTPSRSRGPSR